MIPPYNADAEQSVLGAVIRSNDVLIDISAMLEPSDFYKATHSAIYETMLELHYKKTPIDYITLTEALRQKDMIDQIGVTYIARLTDYTPTTANALNYAEIVKDKSIARQIIQLSQTTIQKALEENPKHLLEKTQSNFLSIATKSNMKAVNSITPKVGSIAEKIAQREVRNGLVGISTGLKGLDRWTAGLQGGQLIIVAGRPAMGKTSLAKQIGEHVAIKESKSVAIFSLEVQEDKLIEQIIISQSGLSLQKARLGLLNSMERDLIKITAAEIENSKIFIDDTPNITTAEITAKCRKIKHEAGLDLVIIDYLQLITPSNKKSNNRVNDIGEISRALKILARELNVPVIALSQLSRSVEQSSDKRPSLSHLRESGSIEADADIVMLLYREDYYNPNTGKQGIAEIILAKQREGPVGTVETVFVKEKTKFYDLQKENENAK